MDINKLFQILDKLQNYKHPRKELEIFYIKQRLDKGFSTQLKQINSSFDYLLNRDASNERSKTKILDKINRS